MYTYVISSSSSRRRRRRGMEANAVVKVHVAWEELCFSGKIMHMFETVNKKPSCR